METMINSILSTSAKIDKTKATSIITIIGSALTLVFNIVSKIFF